jgi:hypothetical protein
MLANLAGGNSVHAPHTFESIQQRIAQHAERLNRWESQFASWQASWKEREDRLDRELALLEAKATAARGGLRQLVVYCEDDDE